MSCIIKAIASLQRTSTRWDPCIIKDDTRSATKGFWLLLFILTITWYFTGAKYCLSAGKPGIGWRKLLSEVLEQNDISDIRRLFTPDVGVASSRTYRPFPDIIYHSVPD